MDNKSNGIYVIVVNDSGTVYVHEYAYPSYTEAGKGLLGIIAEELDADGVSDEDIGEYCDNCKKEYIKPKRFPYYIEIKGIDYQFSIEKVKMISEMTVNEDPLPTVKMNVRRQEKMPLKVNGLYTKKFIEGFFSADLESWRIHALLTSMGLPADKIPFDVPTFLDKRYASWTDAHGNKAEVWFSFGDDTLDVQASYAGKKSSEPKRYLDDFEEETFAARQKEISYDIGISLIDAIDSVFDWEKYGVCDEEDEEYEDDE